MTSRSTISDVTTHGAFEASTSSFSWSENPVYLDIANLTRCNNPQTLVRSQSRVIEAGQFGDETACGLINPGALQRDGSFQLLCRGEPDDSTWLGDWSKSLATPVWSVLDEGFTVRSHFFLRYTVLPPRFRPEDWRLLEYEGVLLTNHSIYLESGGQLRCRPGISMIDLDRQELALRHTLAPPFEPTTEEKNWALFAHEGALLCIYSFKYSMYTQYPEYTNPRIHADLYHPWNQYDGFAHFIRSMGTQEHEPDELWRDQLTKLGAKTQMDVWNDIKNLQTSYLTDSWQAKEGSGSILVDFVGKYETLQRDFNSVCHTLGLPSLELAKQGATEHPPYQECYDSEMKQIVYRHFAVDIERFGYCLPGIE